VLECFRNDGFDPKRSAAIIRKREERVNNVKVLEGGASLQASVASSVVCVEELRSLQQSGKY
jgi:hypothetical protein